MGTGQICTKTLLHEKSNMHEGTLLHWGLLLLEGSFSKRVNYIKNTEKKNKRKINKIQKEKMLPNEGKG